MRVEMPSDTLEDALSALTLPTLRSMMELLPVPKPRPKLKAGMVDAIRLRLTGKSLRQLWERLDETQRLAVTETLTGLGVRFNASRFRVKYGVLPKGFDTESSGKSSLLHFFLYPPDGYRMFLPTTIPRDLEKKLLEFLSEPAAPALVSVDQVPEVVSRRRRIPIPPGQNRKDDKVLVTRRDMEQAASYDLLAVLRLIDQGGVAFDTFHQRSSAGTLRRLGEVLHDGDFFDAGKERESQEEVAGPIRAFAWPWLVQAGKLAQPRGSKLALTEAGRMAFTAPPADTLRRIWRSWLKNTLLDEFSRMDEIKGQHWVPGRPTMTAPRKRRPVVAAALAECPLGRWVQVDEFFRFMLAAHPDFDVTRFPWRLYVGEIQHGNFSEADNQEWSLLPGRYVLCLLFEYAATLGLVDVAFTDPRGARPDYWHIWGTEEMEFLSRYDGLEYFRLNPLGAYCLGRTDRYEPAIPPRRTRLTLFSDLRVQSSAPLPPPDRVLLEIYAEPESDGRWRLDLSRSLSAVERGHDVTQLGKFLAARDDQPLPERVEGFLRTVELGACALKPEGAAVLIKCASKEIADRIVADQQAAKYCRRAGSLRLVVPAKSEAKFRRAAHALGYALSLPRRSLR